MVTSRKHSNFTQQKSVDLNNILSDQSISKGDHHQYQTRLLPHRNKSMDVMC